MARRIEREGRIARALIRRPGLEEDRVLGPSVAAVKCHVGARQHVLRYVAAWINRELGSRWHHQSY